MKHFQYDNYDSINDYEGSVPKHFQDEDSDDWEGSLVFKVFNNLLNIVLYGLIFAFFVWIYNPNLLIREYVGLGLIAGFFMGMFNEINTTLMKKK